ncbi:hypothetical protein [Campylobacter sp.]|nr:hypothetical protein [Campylobacter sp.]
MKTIKHTNFTLQTIKKQFNQYQDILKNLDFISFYNNISLEYKR